MLKRNSQFTLIELIVVIVVLGILAAIVIPNISSFSKEARETQYTADARNIQTGYDMFTAKSQDLEAEALQVDNGTGKLVPFDVAKTLNENFNKDTDDASDKFISIKEGDNAHVVKLSGSDYVAATKDSNEVGLQRLALVDLDGLHPDYLRKVPKYVDAGVTVSGTGLSFTDYDKKPVAVAVLLDTNGNSTSVVNFVTGDETIKGANAAPTVVGTPNLAVIR